MLEHKKIQNLSDYFVELNSMPVELALRCARESARGREIFIRRATNRVLTSTAA